MILAAFRGSFDVSYFRLGVGRGQKKKNNTGGETLSFGCRPGSENLTSLAKVGRETNKEKLLSNFYQR